MSFETATLLLAEDNPGDVFLIRRALEKHGLKSNLLVMEDGQAALKYLESIDAEDDVVCPDLFLLDMNLPRANGGQILARLRQSARCQETPIVVVYVVGLSRRSRAGAQSRRRPLLRKTQ